MNILITGGASGLGEAITKKLASAKKNKVYFTFSKSNEKARLINKEFANTISFHCDYRNSSDVQELIKQIRIWDIDALVNNAYSGDFLKTHFHKIDVKDFTADFEINVLPVIGLTQEAISHFRKKKSGKIISVLTSALVGNPPVGSAVYSAGKAYLAELSKVWATENTKFNISSNTISPSFMMTNFTSSIDERMVEQMKESHPLKALLTAEEVSEAVAFLVNASAQINGIDFVMNAGTSLK